MTASNRAAIDTAAGGTEGEELAGRNLLANGTAGAGIRGVLPTVHIVPSIVHPVHQIEAGGRRCDSHHERDRDPHEPHRLHPLVLAFHLSQPFLFYPHNTAFDGGDLTPE